MTPSFDDSSWPQASEYSAQTVGVNFPAYTNMASAWTNARFIWSSNLILDNLVCLRTTVGGSTEVGSQEPHQYSLQAQSIDDVLYLRSALAEQNTADVSTIRIYSLTGELLLQTDVTTGTPDGVIRIALQTDSGRILTRGLYGVELKTSASICRTTFIHQP